MADFVSNDTGSSLSVPCVDASGNAIDLTACTVELHWRDPTGAVVSRDMTVDDAEGGICSYKFAEGELFAPAMSFEVELTDAGGYRLSNLDLIAVTVRAQLL